MENNFAKRNVSMYLTKQVVVSWEPQVIFSVTIFSQKTHLKRLISRVDKESHDMNIREHYKIFGLTNPSSDISMSWYSVRFTWGTCKQTQWHVTCNESRCVKEPKKCKFTDITVVRRGDNIFKLFAIEDVNSDKVALGMTMLPSFRGWNLHNLHNYLQNSHV